MASGGLVTGDGDGAVISRREGAVLRIVLSRPDRRNALSAAMISTLIEVLSHASVDDALRAVLIEGAGSDFCAGADWVATNNAATRPRAGHLARRVPLQAHRVIELVYNLQLPVIASVRGWAVGLGLGLALASDFTVSSRDAIFWAPFGRRGFTPDSGTTWLAQRLVGMARAKELLLLGRRISGAEAAEMGLIHRAVDEADLDATVAALVAELADGPTVALGMAKAAIHRASSRTLTESLADEAATLDLASRTLDFKEGLNAFVNRRDPTFQGR
jgi:2-(1,2-epoxy-1,2-dihydrophenyl)acetyl-CoA isomerase